MLFIGLLSIISPISCSTSSRYCELFECGIVLVDFVKELLSFYCFLVLLKHGGDVNAVDNSQQTALHWSAVRGAVSVADILLQNGARVEAADINGYRVIGFLVTSILSFSSIGNMLYE